MTDSQIAVLKVWAIVYNQIAELGFIDDLH